MPASDALKVRKESEGLITQRRAQGLETQAAQDRAHAGTRRRGSRTCRLG